MWMPEPNDVIPVYLPQEIVRGVVQKKIGKDKLRVALSVQPPMGKSHSYRFNQHIVVHRQPMQPMGEKWVVEELIDAA